MGRDATPGSPPRPASPVSRRLEATAEEVCDDYVVHLGRRPPRLRPSAGRHRRAVASAVRTGGRGHRVAAVDARARASRGSWTRRGRCRRAWAERLLAFVLVGGLLGTLAAGLVGLSESASGVTTPDDDEKPAKVARATNEPTSRRLDDDLVTVRGQVRRPGRQADAERRRVRRCAGTGTSATASRWRRRRPTPTVDSRFPIASRNSPKPRVGPINGARSTLRRFADGYRPGLGATTIGSSPAKKPTVKLAVDDVPIEGRVIDLEGNPVAGATIEVGSIAEPKARQPRRVHRGDQSAARRFRPPTRPSMNRCRTTRPAAGRRSSPTPTAGSA